MVFSFLETKVHTQKEQGGEGRFWALKKRERNIIFRNMNKNKLEKR
jgi:hypothetical protein